MAGNFRREKESGVEALTPASVSANRTSGPQGPPAPAVPARTSGGSTRSTDPEVSGSPEVVGPGRPPAASSGRPAAVCQRQMTGKGPRGWRALGAPAEERDGCGPAPLALTGLHSAASAPPGQPGPSSPLGGREWTREDHTLPKALASALRRKRRKVKSSSERSAFQPRPSTCRSPGTTVMDQPRWSALASAANRRAQTDEKK